MPKDVNPQLSYLRYLQDGGEMGQLIRSFDWGNTVLGNPEGWSQSLLTAVGIILKSKCPMFIWWGKDLIQFYNDAYKPSLGNNGKHPKALGQKGEDCWPETWLELKPVIDRVLTFSESSCDEDRLIPIYQNGHIEDVYWTFSYSPITDGTGRAGGILAICNETTDKVKAYENLKLAKNKLYFQDQETEKRAKELIIANEELVLFSKIEESESHFRSIVEQAITPILILKGTDLILELANEPLFRVWNVNKDAIGKPFLEILPEMKGQAFEKLLLEVLRNGVTHYGHEHPAHFVLENGETRTVYFDFVYQPYRESDENISGVIVQANDVTLQFNARKEIERREIDLIIANQELAFQNQEKEKRATELVEANKELINLTQALSESETLFRNMMEAISQIAWTLTVDGEGTFFNQRWYDYTGLDYQQTKAHGWHTVMHPNDLKHALESFLLIQSGSSSERANEVRYERADGTYRWHLVSMLPIKNEDGGVRLWIVSATDIQDLKELQQQKDDFISIASHELKTPMTTLTASLQLLNRLKDNPSHKMFPSLVERSNKSLGKLNILIKDLLNVSRFNEGQLHVNKLQFIISEMVDDCCTQVRAEGVYSFINEGDMDLQVNADADRIGQVIINFINNAIKYAPKSKEIQIDIEKIENMAKVSVIDKGPGIAIDKLPHLFDRYFRVDNSGSQYSGLGLGLYISSEIIKKHGGQIGANSEIGKGSTFWFTLPLL